MPMQLAIEVVFFLTMFGHLGDFKEYKDKFTRYYNSN